MLISIALIAFSASHPARADIMFSLRNVATVYGLDAPMYDAAGQPLEGPTYRAELYGSVEPDSLVPALQDGGGPGLRVERRSLPFESRGYFGLLETAVVVVATPVTEDQAWLQVRAWDTRLGPTYEVVAARGLGGYGESPLFRARGANPDILNPEVPSFLLGLESFRLLPVIPEPSTWALLALGGVAIAWRLRKRSSGGRRFGSAHLQARQNRGVACGFEALRPGQRRGVGREASGHNGPAAQ